MNEQTLEKMSRMKLTGMARALRTIRETGTGKLTPEEFLAHLIDTEYNDRHNRKLERMVKQAKFRYHCGYPDIDFKAQRNLEKTTVLKIGEGNWIKKCENIIITGPTGAGKSYLACAIGNQMCMMGFGTLYWNCGKLFTHLKYSKANGSYLTELDKIRKQDVLILDDFGLKPFDAESRYFLLEILEERYMSKPVLIASQLPVDKWHELIGDSTIADAILDRLVHNSIRLELYGESMRKKKQEILS